LAKEGPVITPDMMNTDNASENKSLKHAVNTADFKILVVEDNEINQLAAKMILEQIGFKMIEIAGNGKKAFDMIRQSAYDLVFMDIQMPVMDGLTATGKIRAWEKERIEDDKHLPIIAMTANAIEGDREKCIKAGMDDYISKPVRKENLISILTQWAGVKPVHQQR
jgi:CheY-like chemotaxis protein